MLELLNVFRRLRIAGFAFLSIILIGTVIYYVIGPPGTTLVDAFFMTGITITTIGYKEVINLDHSILGRVFTIILAFAGFGVLTYFATNMAALFIEGEIRKSLNIKRMLDQIKTMEDFYIICGIGRVGRNIAHELYHTDRPMVIADPSQDLLDSLATEYPGVPLIAGDCTDDEFLVDLGVKHAKGLFVVTGDDNTNLVICMTARHINPKLRIVGRSKELSHVRKIQRAGANRVITPNHIGGIRMASEMLRPEVAGFMEEMMKSDTNQRFEEVRIPTHLNEKRIKDLPFEDLEHTLVIAVKRAGEWIYVPKKKFILLKEDILAVFTTPGDLTIIESRIK
ncbi:MAG: potassium channel protein [Cyclobacteriaceae bacterium]